MVRWWLGAVWVCVVGLSLLSLVVGFPVARASDPLMPGNQAVETPEPPVEHRIFWDDFSTYSRRWTHADSPKASVTQVDGALRMYIQSPGVFASSAPDYAGWRLPYAVSVDVTLGADGDGSEYGLIVGYKHSEEYYLVGVSTDGRGISMRRQGTSWTNIDVLGSGDLPPVAHGATHTLRVDVMSERLLLSVDGHPAGEIWVDGEAFEGGVGLFAQAGKGFVDVMFDNVVVTSTDRHVLR